MVDMELAKGIFVERKLLEFCYKKLLHVAST